jgi:3-methyl-2-oxobutanoate hydroxymethyltransferase
MSAQPRQGSDAPAQPPVTVTRLMSMKSAGEKIAMLTCYDASFATLMDNCGVDILLIGDSLGMVVEGYDSTLPVTMDDMLYHTRCVARGARRPLVVADMPFGSYQKSPEQAYENAARFLAAGAHMVKLEGGEWLTPTLEFLARRDIPVCGHIGLTPQSVHALGGYKVQGRGEEAAARLLKDATSLENAGVGLLVLEAIPRDLGANVSKSIKIPTIGIGAGPECDGQVLVMHDLLGVYPGRKARFVRNFMEGSDSIQAAVSRYVTAVKEKEFPAAEHCF